jgi:septal ring factor EnvC (AmiA/AmiB activator)
VSRLAPQLGGPAMVAGQQMVQEQIQRVIEKQAAVIREQRETIEDMEEYINRLHGEIAALRRQLGQ